MGILNLTGDAGEPSNNAPVEAPDTKQETMTVAPAEGSVPSSVDGEDKKKEAVVVMDGPLGHIYTQALNLALAKEDTGTMFSIVRKIGEAGRVQATADFDPALVTADGTYVYAVDDKNLEEKGLVPSIECLRQAVKCGKYKQVVLAIESHNITNKLQLLDETSRHLGVKVCFTRDSVVNTLKGRG